LDAAWISILVAKSKNIFVNQITEWRNTCFNSIENVWWKLMKTDEILNYKKLTFNLQRIRTFNEWIEYWRLKELKDEKWMNWILNTNLYFFACKNYAHTFHDGRQQIFCKMIFKRREFWMLMIILFARYLQVSQNPFCPTVIVELTSKLIFWRKMSTIFGCSPSIRHGSSDCHFLLLLFCLFVIASMSNNAVVVASAGNYRYVMSAVVW
jgi:hypothetical protein